LLAYNALQYEICGLFNKTRLFCNYHFIPDCFFITVNWRKNTVFPCN